MRYRLANWAPRVVDVRVPFPLLPVALPFPSLDLTLLHSKQMLYTVTLLTSMTIKIDVDLQGYPRVFNLSSSTMDSNHGEYN